LIEYIVRRLIQSFIVIIIVSVAVFLLMRLLPGDPIYLYIAKNQAERLTPAEIETIRVEFGLDKPMSQQYFDWMKNIFHGDFGASIFHRVQVAELLKERLPVTLHLGILSLILSSVLGTSIGLISALRRGGWLDTLLTSIANFGVCLPVFWLGILMVYIFSLSLGWLPVQGYTSPFEDFWLSAKKSIMPVICLSVVALASIARQTRSSMLEVIQQDYIRTAWSKGLREWTIVMGHLLKNGLIPVVTFLGLEVSVIIGGSVLVETVFNIPGMGRLMVDALLQKDYPIVQGGCLVIAAMVTLINLLVDLAYGWLDPRIRYE
jgi:peptide/nickel transport system permease protein